MTLRSLTLLIFLTGLGIFLYSLSMPYYKDSTAADNLIASSYEIDKTTYYKQEAALRTNKTAFMDLGSGIAVASLVLLIFFLVKGVRTISELGSLRSMNKLQILILSNLVWLLLIPGTYWYYSYRLIRGDYPPFSDSIAIPINTQIRGFTRMMIPLNVFLLLTLIRSTHPTKLFINANTRSWPRILLEVFFGFWLLVNLMATISDIISGDHFSIPVSLFFTYILLSLRAGQLSRWAKPIASP